jgi:hypothetical protein
MISLTLVTALAVKLMGAFLVVSTGFTSGVVVVAIGISLKGLTMSIAKPIASQDYKIRQKPVFKPNPA